MKKYLFSLFVRFFIAVTGFFVFILSALLYGPEGRGLIAYGTSLVSIFSLMLSLNFGRAFLFDVSKNGLSNKKLLHEYISLNFLLIILTILFVLIFGLLHGTKNIVSINQLLLFLTIIPYYLWSVNGTVIFAAVNLSYKQELIILLTRSVLVIFLAYELWMPSKIESFILVYGSILGCGALIEIMVLGNPMKELFACLDLSVLIRQAKNTFWPHMDYLSFHTFPLMLVLICSQYLGLKEVGRLNFGIQLVNFVFLFSFVASIRVKSYVAFGGSLIHYQKIKKIFWGTLLLSGICVVCIFIGLRSQLYLRYFESFGDVHTLFLIFSLAVPGYMIYNFLYPISIENDMIKLSAKLNMLNFICFLIIALFTVKIWQSLSACLIYSGFYLVTMVIQLYLNRKIFTLKS